MVNGYINSIETFGTLDGPGIRYVIFLQGCNLKCKYCHNRNAWEIGNYKKIETPQESFDSIIKYKSFIKNGGVTLSGGEPLLQSDYCLELFKILKTNKFHTALDTSGSVLNHKVKELLNYTDLVLLDIKSINKDLHKELTCSDLQKTIDFINYLKSINKKIWVRHVIVPTLTDSYKDLNELALFLTNYKDIIEKIDLLPYHIMGVSKWENMNKIYPLKNIPPLSKEKLENAKDIFKKLGFIF